MTDIPNHENLIVSLFTTAFDIVSGSGSNPTGVEVSKSVEYHLKNLLASVVDEVNLPQDVTDIIISQFMRIDPRPVAKASTKSKRRETQDTKQATLLLKDYPPAYNMAKSLCTTCPDKMTAHITQYFGTVIVDATSIVSSNGADKASHRRISDVEASDDEHEGLADLRKAHRLLRELWRACPDVLINVVPQIEAEFSADSSMLRQLATETIGDMTAGIGIAGLAPTSPLDPAAYPLPSIEQPEPVVQTVNHLFAPASPKPFSAVHASAYQVFYGRRQDKIPAVRSAWAIAASKILLTSAGGIGLNDNELQDLLSGFAHALRDHEEHVRLVAVRSLHDFSYHALINIMGADGGLSKPNTVFSTLAERVTDRKQIVREEAIHILSQIWGVASRDIENGVEAVKSIVGDFPNRLLWAYYTNDKQIHALIDKAMHESLLPLSFPPIKVQISRAESQRQKAKDKENNSQEEPISDPDAIRASRILTLVQGLDAKSRPIFFHLQNLQAQISKAMLVFLQRCEEYNGGVVEEGISESTIKGQLTRQIEHLSRPFPNPGDVTADLWRFAKQHNRRWYQLIRFASGPENDYRTVTKAIKELQKRIRESASSLHSLLETVMPLVLKCSLTVFNRSHVPKIMDISRNDEGGLADVAHEILREISARNPEVLKYHIQALCQELEEEAPTQTKFEEAGAANTLKACAAFARKYPADVPKERKFLNALTNFALYSQSPRAAKHAVSILLHVAEKKEMYARDILSKALRDCRADSNHFLGRLATISQICLLAPSVATVETEAILKLAVTEILLKSRSPSTKVNSNAWDEVADSETMSKALALKILVNLVRSQDEKAEDNQFQQFTNEAFKYLTKLVKDDGEIATSRDTPASQRNHLRLTAARFILKLCTHKKKCEELVSASMFNSMAMILINPPNAVRTGFVNQLKKYLGHGRLAHRWFTTLFLLAFEPDNDLKISTMAWLKSRVQYFAKQQLQAKNGDKKGTQNVMESIFSRLLSLLAHHPDYPSKDADDFDGELLDFSKYIIFYLVTVATEDNLSLIFHVGQRVKGARDGITGSEDVSERLYVLSDLAQTVMRNYADLIPAHAKGVNLLQTWPGQVTLPRTLFKALPSHEVAQEIAEKNYLPEDVASGLEKLVRSYVRQLKNPKQPIKKSATTDRKRKSDVYDLDSEGEEKPKQTKKAKRTTLAIRKSPKQKRQSVEVSSPVEASRKSSRVSNAIKYTEADSDEDDAQMEENNIAESPTSRRKRKALEIDEDESDNEMDENPADEEGDERDVASEQEVQADQDEAEVENDDDEPEVSEIQDEEMSIPSPSRNTKKAVGKSKGRAPPKKTTPAKKTPPAKQTPERSTRSTRQTRGTKA